MASNDPLTQLLDSIFGQYSGVGQNYGMGPQTGAPTQLPGANMPARHPSRPASAPRPAPMTEGRSASAPGSDEMFPGGAPMPPVRPAGLLGGAPGSSNPIMQPGMPQMDPSAFLQSQGIPQGAPPMQPQMQQPAAPMMAGGQPAPYVPPQPMPGDSAHANVQAMLGNGNPMARLPLFAQGDSDMLRRLMMGGR